MTSQVIRIGLVGAGANTRQKHIPGLRAIPGVEIVGVVNRTAESTARTAHEFSIPRQYPNWRSLIADPDIDAVVIGTWPNLHCDVTCAALAAGKHVLTEARMARNLAEARQMLDASQRHPHLVAQVVPSPFGLVHNEFVRHLIEVNFLGDLRELVVIGADDQFQDYTEPLHWRQNAEISGLNVLSLGILHETLLRWTPQPVQAFAQMQTFEPARPSPDEEGQVPVTVPDSVQVLTQLPDGARGLYHLSGIELFGPGKQIHLYGSLGTIKLTFNDRERLFVGRTADADLTEVELAPEKRGGWRVEAEFIAAIRGEEPVRLNDFATAVRYMEFTEAVARSAQLNQPVQLPLSGLSDGHA